MAQVKLPVVLYLTLGLCAVFTVAGLYFVVSNVRKVRSSNICGWWRRRQRSAEAATERKVLEIFQETRLRRYKWMLTRCSVLGSLPLATVIALLAVSSWEDQSILLDYMLKTPLLDVVVCVLLSLLVHFRGGCLSILATDLFFGLLFVAIGSHAAFSVTACTFVSATRGVQTLQLCLASVIGDRRRISVALLVNTAIQLAIILTAPELKSLENGLNVVTFNTLAFSIAYLTESVEMEEARAMVGQLDATRGETTALSLLQVMCDAVVHLKSDHSLREPSARLDALLLRHTSPWKQGEAGPLFNKYLPSQDVPRFQAFLEAAQPGQAGSLNVSLLDSLGNLVSSQLYHTCIQRIDGELEHLVGITEENHDGARQQEGILNSHVVSSLGRMHAADILEEVLDTQSERSHRSAASSKSRRSVLYVDPLYPFKILQALPGVGPLFGMLTVQCEGSNLADWMKEPKALQEWLEAGMSAVQQDRQSMGATFGPVEVRPQSGTDGRWRTVTFLVAISYRSNEPPQVEIEIKRAKPHSSRDADSSAQVAEAVAAHRARAAGANSGLRSRGEDLDSLSICGSIVPSERHARPASRDLLAASRVRTA